MSIETSCKPSAPHFDPPPYQNIQVPPPKYQEPVDFENILFLRDYRKDAEFWKSLSECNFVSDLLSSSSIKEQLGGVLLCFGTGFLLPLALWAISSYANFKFKNMSVYNDKSNWERLRIEAKSMDFESLVRKHGLPRIHRYKILDTEALRGKFEVWLNSDKVRGREWSRERPWQAPYAAFTCDKELVEAKLILTDPNGAPLGPCMPYEFANAVSA